MDEDRKLVVAYLHAAGSRNDVLSDAETWELYCLADGFGKRTPEELEEINGGWDWSHVRDSSPEAFAKMAAWLRDRGYGFEGTEPTP